MKNFPDLSLNEYVIRRTGIPLGASGSLTVMLSKSLGARSPRVFWQYWNPIFSYYLGKYVYSGIRKVLPSSASVLVTFLASGAIHDIVTLTVRGYTRFFFSLFFLILSLGVLFTEAIGTDLSEKPKYQRVIFNLLYITVSFTIAYSLTSLF